MATQLTRTDEALSTALTAWTEMFGAEHVRADAKTLATYSRTALPQGTTPAAVVRPGCTADVRRICEFAYRHDIPLHPISGGKNWGYGAACAPDDGYVIVDLRRMNRIVEVNTQLAYAVIEPGVSQQQMYQYLCDHDLPLILDVTGAGPEASIVGNTLQRGFGHTPYGNHFTHTSGMEVVLRDGRVVQTGYGGLRGAHATRVFPWGLGPFVDGLFSQSDHGIVTKMGIWLMPRPESIEGFAFKLPRDSDIESVVDAIRELRLAGVVQGTVHMANDLRVLSARRRYPWDLTGGRTPLPDAVRQQLRREGGIGAWNVMGGLYGTRAQVAAARKAIRRRLGRMTHVHIFGPRKFRWARRLTRALGTTRYGQILDEMVSSAESVYRLLEGNPTGEHLSGVFWRTRHESVPDGSDPAESGCIWLSPVFPLEASHARRVLDIVQPVWDEFQFEMLVTITAITERAGVAVLSIGYDRTVSGESERAAACYKTAFERLADAGYYPYRLGIQSAHALDAYYQHPPLATQLC